ncbi:MAG: MotA/TolQ/ExbB proton channel family protein [Sumerlaeia bacterium]
MNLSYDELVQQAHSLWEQGVAIWLSGGWAMLAIAGVAMLMFGLGVHVYLILCGKAFFYVREKTWRKWLEQPELRKGQMGELLEFVTGGKTIEDTAVFFKELQVTEIEPIERDLRVMNMCVSAAPLFGLLGTVTGMLATFAALASGSGGDKTMELIASGISEALVTTETGLVIALPGLFFQFHLARTLDKYKAFLAHLETVVSQKIYKDLHSNDVAE